MAKFVNCTRNKITVRIEGGGNIEIEPSGKVVRSSLRKPEVIDVIEGIMIYSAPSYDIIGAPQPEEGVYYIVPKTVAAVSQRPDFVTVCGTTFYGISAGFEFLNK